MKSKTTFRSLFIFSNLLIGIFFLLPPFAAAQSETATVLGTVRDPNAAVVSGAPLR